MIGIPAGLLASNAMEWAIHKHVLHGRGRDRSSLWAFHWHQHHRQTRKNGHRDDDYARPLWASEGMLKEAVGLAVGAAVLAPLFPVAPFFVGTCWYSAANYYRVHKRAHLDPAWARAHLPWHYDHHMGPDQNTNWCVTRPWFDVVMGTRKPYLGTARAMRDDARRPDRSADRSADRSTASAVSAAG